VGVYESVHVWGCMRACTCGGVWERARVWHVWERACVACVLVQAHACVCFCM